MAQTPEDKIKKLKAMLKTLDKTPLDTVDKLKSLKSETSDIKGELADEPD